MLFRSQAHGGTLPENISHHAGVITAVRVVGISQINYLDAAEKERAIKRAQDLLNGASVLIP